LRRKSRKNRRSSHAVADVLERRLLLSSVVTGTEDPSGANLDAQFSTAIITPGISADANAATSPPPVTISGTVFYDLNGNGVFDAGDQALPGRMIFRDYNNNGVFDWGEQQAYTDSSGNYTLQYASAGTYIIGVVPAVGGSPASSTNAVLSVSVSSGQTASDQNFAFQQTQPTALIQGRIYTDKNANGVFDTGDLTASLVTVYIDVNNNGAFDTGEPLAITDASGNYSLTVLGGTSQVVRTVFSTSSTYYYSAPSTGYYNVSISPNQVATGYDFAKAPGVSISGSFHNDLTERCAKIFT